MTLALETIFSAAESSPVQTLLALDGIAHAFGGLRVLTNVSFTVPERSIVGLIGPNGSGKTTLFNIVSGFLRPRGGRVLFEGREITGDTIQARSRAGLVRTFQTPKVFERMSVLENLMVGSYKTTSSGVLASMLRSPNSRRELAAMREQALEACDKFEIAGLRDVPAGALPAGQRRIVELARACIARPRILLLDEPSSGLNTEEIRHLSGWMEALNRDGLTILLVSHDMGLMNVCETVHALTFGEIVASGPLSALQSHPRVREAYLGV